MNDISELDKIAAEAAAETAEMPQQAQAVQVQPAEVMAKEIGGLVTGLVGVLSPAFPSLKTIYTPEAIGAAAAAVSAVCVKHGWLESGLMGEYGEEITALIVCGPLAVATYQGVKGDMARMKEKAKAEEPVQAVPPVPPAAHQQEAQPPEHVPMKLVRPGEE